MNRSRLIDKNDNAFCAHRLPSGLVVAELRQPNLNSPLIIKRMMQKSGCVDMSTLERGL